MKINYPAVRAFNTLIAPKHASLDRMHTSDRRDFGQEANERWYRMAYVTVDKEAARTVGEAFGLSTAALMDMVEEEDFARKQHLWDSRFESHDWLYTHKAAL